MTTNPTSQPATQRGRQAGRQAGKTGGGCGLRVAGDESECEHAPNAIQEQLTSTDGRTDGHTFARRPTRVGIRVVDKVAPGIVHQCIDQDWTAFVTTRRGGSHNFVAHLDVHIPRRFYTHIQLDLVLHKR